MNTNKQTIEWVPFELSPFVVKDGVTSERLIRVDQHVENCFLKTPKGYIKRSLLKGKEGHSVDIIYWQSDIDTTTAANESPIYFECFSLMQGAARVKLTLQLPHRTVLSKVKS